MRAAEYPAGLKPGDFIQLNKHFGDVFFEVISCFGPSDGSDYWHVQFASYPKYGTQPRNEWANSASTVRRVIPAEMAEPVMRAHGFRWYSLRGQYDPLYGYAPRGKALRNQNDPF